MAPTTTAAWRPRWSGATGSSPAAHNKPSPPWASSPRERPTTPRKRWGVPPEDPAAFFDSVQELAEAPRVTPEPSGANGGIRLQLFETNRQFARLKLAETNRADVVHRRLAQWVLAMVERAEPELMG